MAELKNGFFYTTEDGETSFVNISLDGKNISIDENGRTLEQSLSKQEKIEEKVISCLTDKSIDKINEYGELSLVFPADISYYKNLIIFISHENNRAASDKLYIINSTTGAQYHFSNSSGNNYTITFSSDSVRKLYVYDDVDNFYIYVGRIIGTSLYIDKVTIEKNSSGDIAYDAQTDSYYESYAYMTHNIVYQTTLDVMYYALDGFYVNEAGTMAFVSLCDNSGSYLLTANLSTTSTSWSSPNGLITATSSRIHVCPDVYEEDRFYALYDNQALSISGGTGYQTALKTIQLPYTINETNGHIDYFGGYIVYTTNGTNFYITNVTTSETKQLTCEDELLSFDASKITELRVKKYTISGELQFYIGMEDSRHIKFYSDTTSYIRVNYNFLSPYTKPIVKICADPYKNTEKVLIAYNTGRNQIRILNENVGVAGASYFAQEYDALRQTKEDCKEEIYQTYAPLKTKVDNIYVYNTNAANFDQTAINAGRYYSMSSGGPINRIANENQLIETNRGPDSGNKYQKIYYPFQNRSFIRYLKTSGTWTDWQEILTSTDFENFQNNRLIVYDNDKGITTSDLNIETILTTKSTILPSNNYNPGSFLYNGSYYNVGPNKTEFEDMTGSIGNLSIAQPCEEGIYPFSAVFNSNQSMLVSADVYGSDFYSYTQGETEPFCFCLGMILDYDTTLNTNYQEVVRLFNALVLHMNANSTARIVGTTGASGSGLVASNWIASPGLCALAISGTNNGTVTLEIQPLYSNYTKKGSSVSTSINLANLHYDASNLNSYIYLKKGMHLSSLYLDSGSYVIGSEANPVLSTTEIIDALIDIKEDANSPIASEKYVDNKLSGFRSVAYAVCDTANTIAAKTATVEGDFSLYDGACINVRFKKGNAVKQSITLDINNTGAKDVQLNRHDDASAELVITGSDGVLTLVYMADIDAYVISGGGEDIDNLQADIEELRGFTIASEKLVVSSVAVSGSTYTITVTNTTATEGMCYELDTSQGGSSTNIPIAPGCTYRLQGSMGSHGSRISIGSLDSTQMDNVLNNGYYIHVLTVSTTGSGGACEVIDPSTIQAGIQTVSSYYSTPQIVGTWIDGTPVWRIAFKRALTQAEINANSVGLGDLIDKNTSDIFVVNSRVYIYLGYPSAVDDIPCGPLSMCSFALDTYKPSGTILSAGTDGIYGFIDYVSSVSSVTPPASNTMTLGESQLGKTILG